jgi:nucleoid DNA-binding protein
MRRPLGFDSKITGIIKDVAERTTIKEDLVKRCVLYYFNYLHESFRKEALVSYKIPRFGTFHRRVNSKKHENLANKMAAFRKKNYEQLDGHNERLSLIEKIEVYDPKLMIGELHGDGVRIRINGQGLYSNSWNYHYLLQQPLDQLTDILNYLKEDESSSAESESSTTNTSS